MAKGRNRALLDWYRVNRRDLAWRRSSAPWPVLVSEIMLQQTQVGRVEPVYERFIRRFPRPENLAVASRADVIDAWEDLGYLRRAFNLQRAAEHVATHGWPAPDELDRLPGVGGYTKAAVGSIAFGAQLPAIDTNLRRVLSRWSGETLAGRDLERVAHEALGQSTAAEWNQAIMDLAATICRPRNPACGECPVEAWCLDPTVSVVTPRQSSFEGSVRQARAAMLKQLAREGPQRIEQVATVSGLDPATVKEAAEALAREGAVHFEEDMVRLA
jgi:A/G-specific adenine glycosylase